MTNEISEKLATSLTAKTTELIPYLPYLLQNFWELGSDPSIMVDLIKKHTTLSQNAVVLDLACGKGAVSVKIAKAFGVKVAGVDIMSEFIEVAKRKATEHGVSHLCNFIIGDINEAVKTDIQYDCIVLGATGEVLGSPQEIIRKLKPIVKAGGYILLDESFLPEGGAQEDVRYANHSYISETEWKELFTQEGIEIVAADFGGFDNLDENDGLEAITKRANELTLKHPDKREPFEGYVDSQKAEYIDLKSNLTSVTWLLRKL